ncbi:MAG: ribosome biogenesis GTP-binding protein YihA/YsxC [Maricaulaceae bacterium]|jgi:GTP-binding protein
MSELQPNPADPNPADDDLDLEAGRLLFARPVTFLKGVVKFDALPEADRAEVAFAGRSNVGKSSLINALANQKGLARASNAPGRTREINFFETAAPLYVVDLPGYGFARAPKTEIARWTALMRDYLRGRANLRRVFLLIDSRHGLKASDEEVMSALDAAAVSYQIVLTKADKLKSGALEAVLGATKAAVAKRPAAHPTVRATSAETGRGIAELRAEIAGLASS